MSLPMFFFFIKLCNRVFQQAEGLFDLRRFYLSPQILGMPEADQFDQNFSGCLISGILDSERCDPFIRNRSDAGDGWQGQRAY